MCSSSRTLDCADSVEMIYTESHTMVDEMAVTSPTKTPSSADLGLHESRKRTRSATQSDHLSVKEYLDDDSRPMIVYRPPHGEEAVYYSFHLFCAAYLHSDTGACVLTDGMIVRDPRPSTGSHLVVDAARKVCYVDAPPEERTEAKAEVRLVDGRVIIDNPDDILVFLCSQSKNTQHLHDAMYVEALICDLLR